MARRQYSEETKAAVLAAYIAGTPPVVIAEEYEVPVGTIRVWGHRLKPTYQALSEPAKLQISAVLETAEMKRARAAERISDLLVINLERYLEATESIARLVADAEYVRSQPAAELATLFGVISDKGVRLVGLLHGAGVGQSQEIRQLPESAGPPVDRAEPPGQG